MKKPFIMFVLTMLFACSQQKKNDNTVTNSNQKSIDSVSQNKPTPNTDIANAKSGEFQTSTYDDPEFETKLTKNKEDLKQLSDKNVFSAISGKLIQALSKKHQDYFKTKSDYELLSYAKGDLFQENGDDSAFIVYDKKNSRISILVYEGIKDKYFELFRDIKVENGLETADCSFGSFGTLDYRLGNEIVYQTESLLKNPEGYLESTSCKITDISKDEDFIIKEGCFSKKASKTNLSNSLCLATDSVYNSWECLKYDKKSNSFLIYYGQAFAD